MVLNAYVSGGEKKGMPRRFHKQADFNIAEIERIKKVQGDKTDYRFFREAILDHVSRTETNQSKPSGSPQGSGKPEKGAGSSNERDPEGSTDIW